MIDQVIIQHLNLYFEYCDVKKRRVNVDEIKNKHFENVRAFKLCFRSMRFKHGQVIDEPHTHLSTINQKVMVLYSK